MRNPQTAARFLLVPVVLSTIFADYWEYSKVTHADPTWWQDVLHGTAVAPIQYRIGVPHVAQLLIQISHGHVALRHAFAAIDLFSAVAAVYLLLSVLEQSPVYRHASNAARWFGVAVFLFLIEYFLQWTTWYQRPETMASIAVIATTLWLISVPQPRAKPAAGALVAISMILLAAMQGFIRADVAVAVHAGILIVCLAKAGTGLSLPRPLQFATSALAILTAGGIQYYLMRVVYPHATYGDTPVFQAILNLTSPLGLMPFALFMLPWAWLTAMTLRKRCTLSPPSWALLTGSAFYLGLWWMVGRFEEVRIFMPYALALVPATAACAMQQFVPETL